MDNKNLHLFLRNFRKNNLYMAETFLKKELNKRLAIALEREKKNVIRAFGGGKVISEAENNYRPLSVIAREIKNNWKNVSYAAKPYLDAMLQLESINDSYYEDSGRSIVAYFLSNSSQWKGDVAKRIKAELRAMLAGKPVSKESSFKNLEDAEKKDCGCEKKQRMLVDSDVEPEEMEEEEDEMEEKKRFEDEEETIMEDDEDMVPPDEFLANTDDFNELQGFLMKWARVVDNENIRATPNSSPIIQKLKYRGTVWILKYFGKTANGMHKLILENERSKKSIPIEERNMNLLINNILKNLKSISGAFN